MKVCILMGSPRLNQNTAEICRHFVETLKANDAQVKYITVADKNIAPCKGCYACQSYSGEYGCVLKDDMYAVVENLMWADCIVIATPIYTWSCPAEMKALIDRLYGMNKFYGVGTGSLWKGKNLALITTHGYSVKYATEPFEMGIQRLCEHSDLCYKGMYSVRDKDNIASFQTEEAVSGAKNFALHLLGK